jgi:hypothetical protein
MRKLLLYFVVLFIFISCGGTSSKESYLKIVNITTTDTTIITINFNEEITKVNMALINTNEISGEVLGTSKIINKKLIFTPQTKLVYATYKVNIQKEGTMSSSNKTLKENYSYTFTIKPKTTQTTQTMPDNIPSKNEEDKPNIKEDEKTNQSYSTCDLIPQMDCNEIKSLPNK